MIEKGCINWYQSRRSSDLTAQITVAEEVEMESLRQDIDELKDRFQKTSEKWNRSFEEFRRMIGTIPLNDRKQYNKCGFSFELNSILVPELPAKCLRIELPRFYGENVISWLYECEHIFKLNHLPDESKLELAVMHMDGRALQWHRIYIRARLTCDPPQWKEYVQALKFRFVKNSVTELENLIQLGSIEDYLIQFDEVLKGENVFEHDVVDCFMRGLKNEIQSVVMKFHPRTLQEASCLAKLQEQVLSSIIQRTPFPNHQKVSSTYPSQAYHIDDDIPPFRESDVIGNVTLIGEPKFEKCHELPSEEEMDKNKESEVFVEISQREVMETKLESFSFNDCPSLSIWDLQDVEEERLGVTNVTIVNPFVSEILELLSVNDIDNQGLPYILIGINLRKDVTIKFKAYSWLWGVYDYWGDLPKLPMPPPEPPPGDHKSISPSHHHYKKYFENATMELGTSRNRMVGGTSNLSP